MHVAVACTDGTHTHTHTHIRGCTHRVLTPQPNPQAGIKPPTFVLFCNDTKLFPDDYRKYIERQFRWVCVGRRHSLACWFSERRCARLSGTWLRWATGKLFPRSGMAR